MIEPASAERLAPEFKNNRLELLILIWAAPKQLTGWFKVTLLKVPEVVMLRPALWL